MARLKIVWVRSTNYGSTRSAFPGVEALSEARDQRHSHRTGTSSRAVQARVLGYANADGAPFVVLLELFLALARLQQGGPTVEDAHETGVVSLYEVLPFAPLARLEFSPAGTRRLSRASSGSPRFRGSVSCPFSPPAARNLKRPNRPARSSL